MRRAFPLLAASAALAAAGAWGQAASGLALFIDPARGNCIACHQVPEGAGPAVRANVGPRLDAARLAGWDRARLRALLDDPMRANPDTVMPPFGRHRILDPAEIERLIDYLHALP
ncbi:MAG TPA: sulfur oxidation c-type cytochrome SoxX [Usitatibacteraceae bacterium]|jgi:sulfur-oxidizing protein SoxX|nr:sulfur oxidation c-type cytochrome SoxX [Usitatibacteraceae bacterium]